MARLAGSRKREPAGKGLINSRTIAIVGAATVLIAAVLVVVQVAGGFDLDEKKSSVPKPSFSKKHGFYSASFSLELTAKANRSIRYTTDGSTPTAQKGVEYSSPIVIKGTTAVRAIAYDKSGASEVVTKTYIFLSQVGRQGNSPRGFPKVFAADDGYGPYPADYEMDPEIVDSPRYSNQIDKALTSIPTVSITTDLANLFDPMTGIYPNSNAKGSDWERPISIELIDPAGGKGFTTNAGLRMHGQASRRPFNTPKKSMRIYFKAKYGNGKLKYDLFAAHGEKFAPVRKFDHLILRNGGNRSYPFWDRDQRRDADYVNDEWAREAFLDMGGLAPHGSYAQLYLNGVYWGLYNITERPDAKFFASYFGGDEDVDYDVVSTDDVRYEPQADAGDLRAFDAVFALVSGAGKVSNATYKKLASKVDMTNLADYVLLTHYIGKTDWPSHNWNVWRKRTGKDTRLKFTTWDNDSGLWKVEQNNTLVDDPKRPQTPGHLFLRLTTNPEFRALLAKRVRLHTGDGGALSPEACTKRYTRLTDQISSAIIGESARWGDYARDVYSKDRPDRPQKAGPSYLYSKDLPDAVADPTGAVPSKFQFTWDQVRRARLSTYCPQRTGVLIAQYRANGWYSGAVPDPRTR
jgi:hypothetical protein